MATLGLGLPESVHRKLAVLAKMEGVSLNQLLSSAAAPMLEVALAARAFPAQQPCKPEVE